MWDGCNECRVIIGTGTGIYATFVMTVVAQEDQSRAIWPSCPALGWTGGVDRLTSIPNGKVLTTPKGGFTLETHGPYQHGSGFPAVNGASNYQPVSGGMHASNPPSFSPPSSTAGGFVVGLGQQNIFASEFGSSVYSSFESMAPTIAQKHWSIHGGTAPDSCQGGFASKCQVLNVHTTRRYARVVHSFIVHSPFSPVYVGRCHRFCGSSCGRACDVVRAAT
jgi:beta-mannosidase